MLGGRVSSAMCDSKMRSMEACCFSFRDIQDQQKRRCFYGDLSFQVQTTTNPKLMVRTSRKNQPKSDLSERQLYKVRDDVYGNFQNDAKKTCFQDVISGVSSVSSIISIFQNLPRLCTTERIHQFQQFEMSPSLCKSNPHCHDQPTSSIQQKKILVETHL